MVFRRPLIKGVKTLRSGVSSDPYRLRNIDMGSAYGRRFRNLVTEIGAELERNPLRLCQVRGVLRGRIRRTRSSFDTLRV